MLVYLLISGLFSGWLMIDEVGSETFFEKLIFFGIGLLLGWIVFPLFLIRGIYREINYWIHKKELDEEHKKFFGEE